MTFDQIIALTVLVAVVGVLIHGRVRSDVVALTGAAVLLLLGVVRPVEVQAAFASPAVIALASQRTVESVAPLADPRWRVFRTAVAPVGARVEPIHS